MDVEQVISQFNQLTMTLPNGNYVMTIEKQHKKRTYPQNRLMWMWFECMAQEFGCDRQTVHDHYCTKFLSYQSNVFGHEETVTGGTKNLTTIAMTQFLDKVQADAASEYGIILPNPEDQFFAEFDAYYRQFI